MTDTPGMAAVPRLRAERLLLREGRGADLEPFAALNADPAVAEFLSTPLTREESDAFVGRITAHWRDDGFGLWAVERVKDGVFLGFTGLAVPAWTPGPETEIGWRLARPGWGHGYASEAARAAMGFGFETLGLDEIVSYTTASNTRSRHVMEKLGMAQRNPDAPFDFIHTRLPQGHPLRPHVTYRLSQSDWAARGGFMTPSGPGA